MNCITVDNQLDLDRALAEHPDACIHVSGSATVTVFGSATVCAYDAVTISAFDSVTIRAFGSATVIAFDAAAVRAYDSATVTAHDAATVAAYGSATVSAFDAATVRAYDSATVTAYDAARVAAYDAARVRAYDSATVTAHDVARVTVYDAATVRAYEAATVQDHGPATSITGGVLIPIWRAETAEEWCELHGLDVTDGIVVLFKGVDDSYRSPHGMLYEPGSTPEAPDWDDGKAECGGGLHFSPCPSATLEFVDAERFIACPVRLTDIVVHPHGVYPEKVKAPRCAGPVWECDIDGQPVPTKVEAA